MRKKLTEKRITRCAAALATAMCLMLSACSSQDIGVKNIASVTSRNIITTESADVANYHYVETRDSYTPSGIKSGLIELRIDELTNSFAVYDTAGSVLWSSLPILEDAGNSINKKCDASLVKIKVAGGTDEYILNSQDNSLAYGKAAVQLGGKGALFTYDLFPSEKTAEKDTYAKDDIGFRVRLEVSLADGNLSLSCTYENLTGNKDACIEEIELLNYFGAYNDMGEDNFLFVPDGCGAIIKTSAYDESFESLSYAVYGNDLSTGQQSSGSALLPVFGIRRGNGAVAAIIENGDAVASINATKAKNLSEYNRAYSVFTITPSVYENETIRISKTQTVDEIKICYRFLSGNNATYAGMASAVREQLIRNSVISADSLDSSTSLPFYITLTGTTQKTYFNRIKKTITLTDFEQAQDLLIRVKNKGINSINVVYKSILAGGCDSRDIRSARLAFGLGGSSKLDDLYSYMSAQNMELYIDIDLISSAKGFSGGESENIFGDSVAYNPDDSITQAAGTTPKTRTLRKLKELKSVIASILSDTKNSRFTGFCLDDAGSALYSDFSAGGMLRQEAAHTLASTVSPLSTSRSIIVDTGNFYMLKNADAVINLPLSTNVSKSGTYIPVPFVQLVLHGIADYTGEPINTATDSDMLLRYIEYGACPHYKWNYTPVEDNDEADVYYYENTINSATEFYNEINSALGDLRDARITDHYMVEDGVFCTEYDNGAMIYVNYTGSDCTILGSISIKAGSYLRLN